MKQDFIYPEIRFVEMKNEDIVTLSSFKGSGNYGSLDPWQKPHE